MKRLVLALGILLSASVCGAQQVYNMGFDHWHKKGGSWNPYPEKATDSQRLWDSANRGLKILRINVAEPEYEHVAVKGPGKAAAKISSRSLLWGFIAGNLYLGRFVKVVNFSGIEMYNGVPFSGRPKSLSGYYHYLPGVVDFADDAHSSRKGKTDHGQIEVALYSWSEPQHLITTEGPTPDPEKDPCLIGRAVFHMTQATQGYVHFEVPIEYKNENTPTYLGISVLSSELGEYFTGSSKTVLYLDELQFNY